MTGRFLTADELLINSPAAGIAVERVVSRFRHGDPVAVACDHLAGELDADAPAFAVACTLHPDSVWCSSCGQSHLDDVAEHPRMCAECGQMRDDLTIFTATVPLGRLLVWVDGLTLCAPCADEAERRRP